MAQALDVSDAAGQSLLDQVRACLQNWHHLLVLDNAEHLLDAVSPLVADLLTTCPRLTVLTTSRTKLGISGERVMPIAPLDPETARTLFTQRAEEAVPTFAITPENAAVIDAICERLDRLPLAIELAAARVSVLPLPALLARLEHRLDLLTGGPRDAPDRQHDMRAAIAWSYELLPKPEQVLYRRLGIFVGGFTLDMVQTVAGEGMDVFAGVSTLVAASLVNPMPGVDDEPRFTMLETIREYAAEQLGASGEEPAIRKRHARHMVALAEYLWESPDWPRMEPWFARLRPEIGNLRLALAWTLQHDPAAAVQLAGALTEYWLVYGYLTEGQAWVTQALRTDPGSPAPYRARALIASGRIAMLQVEDDSAESLLTAAEALLWEAVAVAPTVVTTRVLMLCLIVLGDAAVARGDLDAARARFTAAREFAERHAVPQFIAVAQMNLGGIAQQSGDLPAAQDLLEDALARHQASSGPMGVAFGHLFLGRLLRERGKAAPAVEHLRTAFSAFADAGHLDPLAGTLEGLAGTVATSHPYQAARLLGAAAALLNPEGGPHDSSDAQIYDEAEGLARTQLGDTAFAAAWDEGLQLSLGEIRAQVAILADAFADPPTDSPAPDHTYGLTPREREVLHLLAAGLSNREIAAALFISIPTVKRHVTTILGKLDLPSRSAATAFAHTHALR
jgi:non-specific serine/threonine protein kinase